jgi:hypothetical protein
VRCYEWSLMYLYHTFYGWWSLIIFDCNETENEFSFLIAGEHELSSSKYSEV